MQPVILGIILGVAVGLINFSLLIKTAKNVSQIPQDKAAAYVLLRNLIRIVLYGAAVIGSVLVEGINALGTGAGIVAVGLLYLTKYSRNGQK